MNISSSSLRFAVGDLTYNTNMKPEGKYSSANNWPDTYRTALMLRAPGLFCPFYNCTSLSFSFFQIHSLNFSIVSLCVIFQTQYRQNSKKYEIRWLLKAFNIQVHHNIISLIYLYEEIPIKTKTKLLKRFHLVV